MANISIEDLLDHNSLPFHLFCGSRIANHNQVSVLRVIVFASGRTCTVEAVVDGGNSRSETEFLSTDIGHFYDSIWGNGYLLIEGFLVAGPCDFDQGRMLLETSVFQENRNRTACATSCRCATTRSYSCQSYPAVLEECAPRYFMHDNVTFVPEYIRSLDLTFDLYKITSVDNDVEPPRSLFGRVRERSRLVVR